MSRKKYSRWNLAYLSGEKFVVVTFSLTVFRRLSVEKWTQSSQYSQGWI